MLGFQEETGSTAVPSKKQTAESFLRDKLAKLNPNTTMVFIHIEDIQKAIGNAQFNYKHMVEAAEKVSSLGYDLTPRSSDDYSSTPYLWVTPAPKLPEKNGRPPEPPEMCWMGASANGGGPVRIKEGVLIFTKEGYAVGALVKRGVGDIDVRQIPWKKIVESGAETAAVLDYIEGQPPVVIPIS